MRLILSIFAILVQCAISVAWAASGHTIPNGGDTVEMAFREIYKNLPKRMAPCLTPANLCGLTPAQKSTLLGALALQGQCHSTVEFVPNLPASAVDVCGQPLRIDPQALYAEGDKEIPEVEMAALALSALQKCAGILGEPLTAAATRAFEFQSFQKLMVGGAEVYVFSSANVLSVETGGAVQALAGTLRAKLRLAERAGLNFQSVGARARGNILEISGQVIYTGRAGAESSRNFTVVKDGAKVELQVF